MQIDGVDASCPGESFAYPRCHVSATSKTLICISMTYSRDNCLFRQGSVSTELVAHLICILSWYVGGVTDLSEPRNTLQRDKHNPHLHISHVLASPILDVMLRTSRGQETYFFKTEWARESTVSHQSGRWQARAAMHVTDLSGPRNTCTFSRQHHQVHNKVEPMPASRLLHSRHVIVFYPF